MQCRSATRQGDHAKGPDYETAPEMARARVLAATAKRGGLAGLGPSGIEPVGGCGRFVMAVARLRPIWRRCDVADRNGDDPVWIPNREWIIRQVLAEPGDGVLVALVIVRPDVEIAGWRIHAEAFELADDGLLFGPSADELVCPLDGHLEHIQRYIGAFRLEVRIFFPAIEVSLHEAGVLRPAIAAWIGEVIVGVDAREHTLGVILAEGMRCQA